MHFIGEIAALITTAFWTITALAFEKASKSAGSLAVNLIRLVVAFLLLGITGQITQNQFIPIDAGLERWLWLSLSGVIGYVIGDIMLFQAFIIIGARISMLIMSLTPPITAILGRLILDESMSLFNILGMVITLTDICLVILAKTPDNKISFSISKKGILLAIGGATGQALGFILSKKGMGDYDPFAASQIRIIAGIVGLSILFFFIKGWSTTITALKNKKALKHTSIGAIFGPFLGVSLSLFALQRTSAAIVATITAAVPVFIIAPAVLLYKEKITFSEILGALIAVIPFILWC